MPVFCRGCGGKLYAEAFCGPPREDFAEAQLELILWRAGWRDGYCTACRDDAA